MMHTGLITVIFLASLLVEYMVYPGTGARLIVPQTVLQAFPHFGPQNFDHNVIARLRLSRLAAALLTGTSLGVAGALLQAVIHNPSGESHILGLNTGAALAVVAASALGLAFPVGRPLLASTGGALLFLLILLLSSAGRSGVISTKAILYGVVLSTFVSSITAATLTLDEQTLLAMRTWLVGDLAGQGQMTLGTSAWFSLGGFVLALYLAPSFNMLALGDHMVQGLDVSVLRTQTFTLLTIALLCGAAVPIAGPTGFVGLLVPQIVRCLAPVDPCVLLFLSTCVDTLLLLLADITARTLFMPHELVTDVVMALVGVLVSVTMATRMFK